MLIPETGLFSLVTEKKFRVRIEHNGTAKMLSVVTPQGDVVAVEITLDEAEIIGQALTPVQRSN